MAGFSGIFGLVIIIVFVVAIRTSYAIERAVRIRPPGALPVYTNMFTSVFGVGVAKNDHETLALVRRLRWLLLVVLVLMIGLAVVSTTL